MDGRRFHLALWIILLVGITLRSCALGLHSFWFDEVVAMRVATAPTISQMLDRLATTDMVGAPLHPLLLRWWTTVWGTSETAARSLAAAFSILGLFAFAATAWQAYRSHAAALAATALLAICPLDLTYSMENRMYSMLTFWTIACWGLLISFRKGRDPLREIAFGVSLIALGYTHPLGGVMIVALAFGYLIDHRRSSIGLRRWAVIQAAAGLAILPWAGRYMDHDPDPRHPVDFSSSVLKWAAYGLGIPTSILPLLFTVVAAAWVLTIWKTARNGCSHGAASAGERIGLMWMLCGWVVIPLILMSAYSWLHHPIIGPLRYQAFLMPGVILLLAGAVAFRPISIGTFLAALAVVCTMPRLHSEVFNPRRKPEWRSVTHAVLERSPDPTIVLATREPHMYYRTVNYYLPPGTKIMSLQNYSNRLEAGTLDQTRDYWMLRDRQRREDEASSTLWTETNAIDFGRMTAVRLCASVVPRSGENEPDGD